MVTKKDLADKKDNDLVSTLCLVKDYEKKPTKNGGSYMAGQVEMMGLVNFKVWSGSTFDELEKYDYKGRVCSIDGVVNDFNGTRSIIIKSIKALEDDTYKPEDFMEVKYNADSYWAGLVDLVQKKVSPEAFEIFTTVMADIKDRFMVEYAAKGWHDATRSGLLAHSYKVTHIMSRVIKHYPLLVEYCSQDLLILGCALHDIGKVMEYTNGTIVGNGLLVSHHTFGVEILLKYKDFIIEKKNEEFFYRLLAICEQHHGEYEESPRTIEAYMVFHVDYLESRFQILNEIIEGGDTDTISLDNFKLH